MVRAASYDAARLPLVEVDMLTIEELLDAGVVLLEEQVDFFHHPEGRLAVVVYGVPDPDRLYIAGPDREATIYQRASEGEPADDNGMQAVVLPIVVQGGDQVELDQLISDWEGDIENAYPVVHAWPQNTEFMYAWTTDEVPITVACWDLWPIGANEVQHWVGVADKAYWNSVLPLQFELIEHYNGSDYYGPSHKEYGHQMHGLEKQIRALEKRYEGRGDQDEQLLSLAGQLDELRVKANDLAESYVTDLERQIIHPVTGDVDAQLPPVDLPPEQAAIWRSLQSLSWRNWSTLEKEDPTGRDALYGGRFVQANRRLCPWY